MTTPPNPPHPVIFFDGVCGLCNSFADWVMRRDKKLIFRFSPIQGTTAKDYIAHLPPQAEEWSIVYADEKGTTQGSTAVLKILCRLGGGWKLMGIFLIVPVCIREAVYRFIAKRRYRWFGKKESCRLPTPQEKARFLP